MKLGYNRAGRIMDQLEEFGIVGPAERSGKPREVKIKTSEELKVILQRMGIL
jgi:S-DNA-T family DNA segregation ATPase FtsK/SpoIIIE